MNIEGYIPRIVDKEIDDLVGTYGAVSIEGPKYCGKTWTSMRHASSIFALDDPNGNYRNLRIASMDPNAALEGGKPHLIDEWQLVPAAWDAVRRRVDLNPGPGQYILIGSSVPAESGSEGATYRREDGVLIVPITSLGCRSHLIWSSTSLWINRYFLPAISDDAFP
jgi:hypothetical protein